MGDIVHCLPVISALRRALPAAKIAWVVEQAFAPLLEDHPGIDELIPVRMKAWRKQPLSASVRREVTELRRSLRRFAPDVALDLMGNHKGGALARLSSAPRRLGAARPLRREASSAIWINEPVAAAGSHAVDRALAILTGLGLAASGPADFGAGQILTRVPEETQAFLDARAMPFAVIQAGAGWGNKTYPPERWGAVARQLHERAGVEVWVPVAPGEEHLAEAVVAASHGAARSVEAFAFASLAAVLRASRLVLGGDTGPLHLAHALGTPVLCLIGPTDPSRNGPYAPDAPLRGDGAAGQVIWKRLPCSCCYKRYGEPKACLLNISPEEVVSRALDLLQQ